jgi:hypothetical protein
VPSVRPKLFLDTNVCEHLLNPPYADRLQGFLTAVRKRYQIFVSPETVIELLRTLQGGTGEHFAFDQKRFQVCVCGDRQRARFISLPGEFAMKHALGMDVPAKFGANHFRQMTKVVLKADTRTQLFETGVKIGKYDVTFNNAINEEQHEEGMASHRKWMEDIMTGQYQYPTPDKLGIGFAKNLSVDIDAATGAKLVEGISAYFAYQKSLFDQANSGQKLNLDKRKGDWVDSQQLVYLCDPQMHLLTGDGKIKDRAKASEQSKRIFRLSEFAREIGFEGV